MFARLKISKSTLNYLLLGILFYFILLDSGGSIGIRNITILFFIITFLFVPLIKKNTFNSTTLLISIVFNLLAVFILLFSMLNNIEIFSILPWIFFLIFIIVIFQAFMIFSYYEIINGLIFGGYLFAITILVVHLLIISNIIPIYILLTTLNQLNGFFHPYKILGIDYYSIYFQATLTLSTLGVIAYVKDYKFASFIFLLALVFSLSRFGVFTLLFIVFLAFILGKKSLSNIITKYFLLFIILIITYSFFIFFIYGDNYIPTNSSSNIRLGHLISIIKSFEINNFLFGQGAGSFFWTIGKYKYVDNVELSQLEFIRKFGIIIFIIFHILIKFIFIYLYKIKKYNIIIIIFSFYFVSLSNPVLTSISFSIFIGLGLSEIVKQKRN